MTVQPSPYEILRAIQDQQAVMLASQRATDRLVLMLAGMLDGSAPDPFMVAGPPAPDTPLIPGARHAPPTNRDRRQKGENARPPFLVDIAGVEVKTTERRARLLASVMEKPATLSELSRQAIAPTVAGVKAQIQDTNRDLQRAGLDVRVRIQAKPAQRLGAKGGREPALYALLGPKDASPENPPSVQSEAEAGARPEQEAPASAVGEGDVIAAAQDVPFVAQTGAGEEALHSDDPAPAADAPSIPEAIFDAMGIVAIDTKSHVIRGPLGDWKANAPVARTIARINSDGIFGLDVILKAGPWPGTDAFRERLRGIRAGLDGIGAEIIEIPKIGFRLRLKGAS